MVSNVPIQFLLVQLANMYINPQNYNINLTQAMNDNNIGIIKITKDELLDAKLCQDLETENHILTNELNVTRTLLHRKDEENQKLRQEQIRNKVRKVLLRNITSEYIKTKKELDAKIAHLAEVETRLNISERDISEIKEQSESWRQKSEQYEIKFFQAIEGELQKKTAKLQTNEVEFNESEEKQVKCEEDNKWCCWVKQTIGSIQDDNAVINDEEKCKELSLVEASKMGNTTLISELLDADTDIDTAFSKSPLHWATEKGHDEACIVLLDREADINARDPGHFNTTPVHLAAELGQIPTLRLFLKNDDVEIDVKDADGWTPLHWAVTFNKTEAVDVLLHAHADVNATDNDGRSPLHHAALGGNLKIVKKLIAHHASVNARDNEGRTPLHFATLSDHFNASSNISLQPQDNATLGSNPCKMVHHFTSIKTRDKLPMMNNSMPAGIISLCLGKHDCREIATFLLEHHADLFAEDKRGVTPYNGAPPECKVFLKSWKVQHMPIVS